MTVISALSDERIGAGIIWTFGDLRFAIAIGALLQRWLAHEESASERPRTRVGT